ncbi:2433_t:CDS:2 [Funneliformis mosseae]|uniref:2433_t:CDS:1 n=1 Tax=Funneliformis mosseae TaxID=27381 RepID=A0A9N8UYP6_FUNMO|nr:2433_t:CDS:2 [Funneliformis mosseae]
MLEQKKSVKIVFSRLLSEQQRKYYKIQVPYTRGSIAQNSRLEKKKLQCNATRNRKPNRLQIREKLRNQNTEDMRRPRKKRKEGQGDLVLSSQQFSFLPSEQDAYVEPITDK